MKDQFEDDCSVTAVRSRVVYDGNELIIQVIHVEIRQLLAIRAHLVANLSTIITKLVNVFPH